ncbi:acyltransferase family protein [Rhodococcus pyridinivorans]|uniref:acyltransferase family protein n=1 Tax=Rhodococcus pyridinivorans TaxID=103816 RepID=UPI0039C9DE86
MYFRHYWSLALEEQFYLVWPVLVILVTALSRKRAAISAALTTVTAASFILCIFVTDINQPIAFFSLPTRAWELSVGALIASLIHLVFRVNRKVAPGLAWFGLAMIATAALFYDSSTTFPGLNAALPVAGAVAMIVGGTVATTAGPGQILRTYPFQFFGRIP